MPAPDLRLVADRRTAGRPGYVAGRVACAADCLSYFGIRYLRSGLQPEIGEAVQETESDMLYTWNLLQVFEKAECCERVRDSLYDHEDFLSPPRVWLPRTIA